MKNSQAPLNLEIWQHRLWPKIQKQNECWIWKGALSHGKPVLQGPIRSRWLYVAKLTYELKFGPIQSHQRLVATCQEKLCVNPDHLVYYSTQESAEKRFWRKVNKTNKCWLWTGKTEPIGGYGVLWANGKRECAHRFSYQLHYGDFDQEICILHQCDVRICVRPNHLFKGDRTINNLDCYLKGRRARKESHGKCKLNIDDINEIRRLYEIKMNTQVELAERFSVAQSHIGRVVRYELWK